MALDEVLFRRAAASGESFLRFYRWERPTASLGFSQDAARVVDREFCRARGVDIVRRITGGKLVLHDREITYSVASSDAGLFTSTLRESYRLISSALVEGLRRMGLSPSLAGAPPPEYARGAMPCFAYAARDEIAVDGRKIVGSAQKRTGAAFLQHGSIPLEADAGLLREVSRPGGGPAELGMTSLSEALGRPVEFGWAVERLVAGFEATLGVRVEPFQLPEADLAEARRLDTGKYASDRWIFLREE